MNIALDFDDTYTLDAAFWLRFVAMVKQFNHTVHVVTMRYPQEAIDEKLRLAINGQVVYTSRAFKRPYVLEHLPFLKIDIWIDDRPDWVVGPYDPFKPVHT